MSKIREGAWRCNDGFLAPTKNGPIIVPGGALVPYEYPYELMDGREGMFTDISQPKGAAPTVLASAVEQASAAPGERRATRRS